MDFHKTYIVCLQWLNINTNSLTCRISVLEGEKYPKAMEPLFRAAETRHRDFVWMPIGTIHVLYIVTKYRATERQKSCQTYWESCHKNTEDNLRRFHWPKKNNLSTRKNNDCNGLKHTRQYIKTIDSKYTHKWMYTHPHTGHPWSLLKVTALLKADS